MSRVRLTGPYRYLIYVTPDYAIVDGWTDGLDLARGDANQLTFKGHRSDPLVLVTYKKDKCSMDNQ